MQNLDVLMGVGVGGWGVVLVFKTNSNIEGRGSNYTKFF